MDQGYAVIARSVKKGDERGSFCNIALRGFNPVGEVFSAAGQYQRADVLTAPEKL